MSTIHRFQRILFKLPDDYRRYVAKLLQLAALRILLLFAITALLIRSVQTLSKWWLASLLVYSVLEYGVVFLKLRETFELAQFRKETEFKQLFGISLDE